MKNDLILNMDDGDVDAVNAAALAGKLSQMANGAVYDENGKTVHIRPKLDALEDLIEAANGKPVLVAYWFKHDLSESRKGSINCISLFQAGHFGFHYEME